MNKIYKVVIVEDEVHNLELIEHLIESHFLELHIIGKAKTYAEAEVLLKEENIDIAFLDITLHDQSIFDVLEKFDIIPFQIIFITAYAQYALEAIKTSATDYLLKPLKTEEFIEAVNKAKQKSDDAIFLKSSILEHLGILMKPTKSLPTHPISAPKII